MSDRPGQRARFPSPLLDFVELFNRREYWESHEALEDEWRRLDSDFYQGLILYASAFVHAQRGVRHGILAQLRKAQARLRGYPPSYLGIDVAAVLEHAERCRQIARAHPDVEAGAWAALIPFPKLTLDLSRVRGDEPELGGAP